MNLHFFTTPFLIDWGARDQKTKRHQIPVSSSKAQPRDLSWETLIKSLSDFTLEFLCIARNNLTRIASYLRKAMTKLCIKILVESDSAI